MHETTDVEQTVPEGEAPAPNERVHRIVLERRSDVANRICKLGIFLLLVATFAGCTHAPRKNAFNQGVYRYTDLIRMDPANVRVAVCLDDRAVVRDGQFMVSTLLLSDQWPSARFKAPLKVIDKGRDVLPGIPPAPQGRTWYLMAPTQKGIVGLQTAQDEMKFHKRRYNDFKVMVMFKRFDHLPANLKAHFPIKVLLRVPPAKSFMTVFDGYRDLQKDQRKELAVWNHAFL